MDRQMVDNVENVAASAATAVEEGGVKSSLIEQYERFLAEAAQFKNFLTDWFGVFGGGHLSGG